MYGLRPAIVWLLVALSLLAVPSVLVACFWLAGEFPDRESWFAQRTHGPWRWELSGMLLLVALFGLLVTAAGSLLHGLVALVRTRRPTVLLPFVVATAASAALLKLSQFVFREFQCACS